jgi:hypothetical protein
VNTKAGFTRCLAESKPTAVDVLVASCDCVFVALILLGTGDGKGILTLYKIANVGIGFCLTPIGDCMTRLTPATYSEHERAVIDGAEQFVATEFKGRGQYDRSPAKTLAAAKEKARDMIAKRDPADIFNKGRPVLVYAVKGVHQVQCDMVYPVKTNG